MGKGLCFEMLGKHPGANTDVIIWSTLTSYVCASMKMQNDSLRLICSIVCTDLGTSTHPWVLVECLDLATDQCRRSSGQLVD